MSTARYGTNATQSFGGQQPNSDTLGARGYGLSELVSDVVMLHTGICWQSHRIRHLLVDLPYGTSQGATLPHHKTWLTLATVYFSVQRYRIRNLLSSAVASVLLLECRHSVADYRDHLQDRRLLIGNVACPLGAASPIMLCTKTPRTVVGLCTCLT